MSQNNITSRHILKPIVVGCAGSVLTAGEQDLFADTRPAGLILFQRNCVSEQQVTDLISSFRACVGWENAPVLIDQEGGSVSRLKEPVWQEFPPAVTFAELAEKDLQTACRGAYLNAALMGLDMEKMGITVNCAPVMDVPTPECHGFIADSRAYGRDAAQVTALAEQVCRGLLAAAITPVMKHIPGHGRGSVDSHKDLPKVTADAAVLSETDYAPFRNLAKTDLHDALWAMGAHIVYADIDAEKAATLSQKIVRDVIHGDIGFHGITIADDISMAALDGTIIERAQATLASGMDMTLHCNGDFDELRQILPALPDMTQDCLDKMIRADDKRKAAKELGQDSRAEISEALNKILQDMKAVA